MKSASTPSAVLHLPHPKSYESRETLPAMKESRHCEERSDAATHGVAPARQPEDIDCRATLAMTNRLDHGATVIARSERDAAIAMTKGVA